MSKTYIYFIKPIGMAGPIKIGCTKSIDTRLDALMQLSPYPLELMVTAAGDFKLEHHLHARFAANRSHKEWFHPSDELMAGIDRVKAGASVVEAFAVLSVKRSRRGEATIIYLRPRVA